MKNRLLIRGICALVAVQLFAAPFASAYAAAPDEGQPASSGGPEPVVTSVPAPEEAQSELEIMPLADTFPPYGYQLGYGVPVYNTGSGQRGIKAYLGYFRVELDSTYEGEYTYPQRMPSSVAVGGSQVYHVFPKQEKLGRVPDKEFEGWYLYDYYTTTAPGRPNVSDWEFDSAGYTGLDGTRYPAKKIDLLPYTAEDPRYDESPYNYGLENDKWTGIIREEYSGYPGNMPSPRIVDYVGRWVPSSVAAARGNGADGVVLTPKQGGTAGQGISAFYTEDITGQATSGLIAQEFDAAGDETYYLRLDEAVDAIDLTFRAFEPYFDYHMSTGASLPVTVTVNAGGVKTQYPWTEHAMAPQAAYSSITGLYTQANSAENPAHSVWTVRDIPLARASAEHIYNEITITVTAPDGVTQKSYTFHIQRVVTPTLTQNPGNSPVGMILRDTSSAWGTGTPAQIAAAKQAAVEAFKTDQRFDSVRYPRGAENQYGSIFKGIYVNRAWAGRTNYDFSENAIMVYLDTAFQDPGIRVTDTQGDIADFAAGGVYEGKVSRVIALRTADRLLVSDLKSGTGTVEYYVNGALSTSRAHDVLTLAEGKDQVDLRGLNILPGVYTIEYYFNDTMTGMEYVLGSRPLIVLPIPGDVDMDGAVTPADAKALERAVNNLDDASQMNGVSLNTDPVAALVAFRTADLTGNGLLQADDRDKILSGYLPALEKTTGSDYYYIPLPVGDPPAGTGYHSRIPIAQVVEAIAPDKANMASLELRFLGVETGEYHPAGHPDQYLTTDAAGPDWNGERVQKVVLGDTFWVGVYLSGVQASNLNQMAADGITLTLTYDSRYVKPAAVYDKEDAGVGNPPKDETEAWLFGMRTYNISAHSGTIWGKTFDYMTTLTTARTRDFGVHYSRPITQLEAAVDRQSSLKEMVFSIERIGQQRQIQDGWLLVAPFTLVSHPYGSVNPKLIEIGMGMREFLLLSPSAASGALPRTGALSPAGAEVFALAADSGSGVAAYSAQTKIFGDSTNNLRDSLAYTASGLIAPVPIGEDITEAIVLYNELISNATNKYNAVYGDAFSCSLGKVNQTLEGELPPGLTYAAGTGIISGTPTQAGNYRFVMNGQAYTLKVEQASLRFYVDDQATYYGQPDYCRGSNSGDFTFGYYEADIKQADKTRAVAEGISLDGADGNTLNLLLADDSDYIPPAFYALTAPNVPVAQKTTVGRYAIECRTQPMSTNYTFEFIDRKPVPGGSDTVQTGSLFIVARPIRVEHLASGTVVGEVYSDASNVLTGRSARLSSVSGAEAFGFSAVLPPTGTNYYDGSRGPLTGSALVDGDALEITYTAELIRTDEDRTMANETFKLDPENLTESRNVTASNIALSTESQRNYTLISAQPVSQYADQGHYYATGVVKLREITGLTIDSMPNMTFTYGESLRNITAIVIKLSKGEESSIFPYTVDADGNPVDTSASLILSWATPAEKAAGLPGSVPFVMGEILTCDVHNGRYLCVARRNGGTDEDPQYMTAYSNRLNTEGVREDYTLTVMPREVMLAAVPVERYYGELNDNLQFTYDPRQLAPHHYQAVLAAGGTGRGGELAAVLGADTTQGYAAPALSARRSLTNAAAVNETTSVAAAQNAVVYITGAAAINYKFTYANPAQGGLAGSAPLRVYPRPIVVDEILKKTELAFVYADTKEPSTQNLTLSAGQFKLGLPEHTETQTSYFPALNVGTQSGEAMKVNVGFAAGTEPDGTKAVVVNSDVLGLSYTAVLVPERSTWQDYANCYFSLDGYGDTGRKAVAVEVRDLKLTGDQAANYELVYRSHTTAGKCLPDGVNVVNGPAIPAKGLNGVYHVVNGGTGIVKLRAIASIVINSTSNLTFNYGSPFAPINENPTTRTKLVATLVYEKANDNFAGNVTEEQITMAVSRVNPADGTVQTTFSDRGLTMCYQKSGQTMNTVDYMDYALPYGTYLTVPEHDGSRLIIAGKRSVNDPIILSGTAEAAYDYGTIHVNRRALTLNTVSKWRYYGQPNGDLQFTFDSAQLAAPDQKKLTAAGLDGTAAKAAAALAEIGGAGYIAPTFQTAATPGSDVLSAGLDGYPLNLTGGVMDNYTLNFNPGKIYILRRPIRVGSVVSDANNPVYTIFQNTLVRSFQNTLSTKLDGGGARFLFTTEQLDPNDPAYLSATVKPTAPSGEALYGTDELWMNVTVGFINLPLGDISLPTGQTEKTEIVAVTAASINSNREDTPYRNYILTNDRPDNSAAVGLIQLRNITGIRLIHAPDKLRYTYGERLSLSGLQVEITYEQLSGVEGTPIKEVVGYYTKEQFSQYGLYVRYRDPAVPLPGTVDGWNQMVTGYRPASSGDHVTIAPTHDSQFSGVPFAANGKQLVVCAQLTGYDAVQPRLVTVDENNATPVTIQVDPLPLTYTLSAVDKTYDGTADGAGSVSLTNAFHQAGQVDDQHPDGITDVVYLITGAAYEKNSSTTYTDFPNFKTDYADEGYTFTTGRYVEPVDGERNGHLEVTSTGLRFTFLYANVRYAEPGTHTTESPALPGAAYWNTEQAHNTEDTVWDRYGTVASMPVKVEKMTLAGPDAANYCWRNPTAEDSKTNEVLRTTRNAETDGEAAVPYATIRKANREPIDPAAGRPAVQVDLQTNAVRLDYDKENLTGARDPGDEYDDEAHLEYTLQYAKVYYVDGDGLVVPPENICWGEPIPGKVDGDTLTAVATVGYWAGPDGTAAYQDTIFFGGEAVVPAIPAGYVPDARDIPAEVRGDTILKGQVYGWADEDAGFAVDDAAYPGGAAYPGYLLYKTDRTPLPRDTVFWPLVRVAETHNYNAGPPLGPDDGVTEMLVEEHLQAAKATEAAYDAYLAAPSSVTLAALSAARLAEIEKADNLLDGAGAAMQAALDAAEAAMQEELDRVENSSLIPRDGEWPVAPPAAAVKTYLQRLDLISAEERRSAGGQDNTSYTVPTLEAVWFTNHLDYPKEGLMDIAVRNMNPTRYYGYYWDDVYSAKLKFDEQGNPFTLRDALEVEVTRKDPFTGQQIKVTEIVNIDHNALIFTDITAPGGDELRGISVTPKTVTAVLGDSPVQLSVEFRPADVQRKTVTWTTSDPAVATVSERGLVTFTGVGSARVTATAYNGKSDYADITVADSFLSLYPNSVFNPDYAGPAFRLDESRLFFPARDMTRGELAVLLYQFYHENVLRQPQEREAFPDITGEEPYAEAVRVLASLGVLSGVESGDFAGEQIATRAEMVTMLARMLGVEPDAEPDSPPAFLDARPEDTWAWGYIGAMNRLGFLNGTGEGYFHPGRELTRAEAAAFLARLLRTGLDPDSGTWVIPADVLTEHWGYDEILIVVNKGVPMQLLV